MNHEQIFKKLSEALLTRRLELHMTQQELAAKLGCPYQSVYRWETKRSTNLKLKTLVEYAQALDLELEIILKTK